MAAMQKNILEHISLMATEQVQLEFREQIIQLQQLSQQAAVNPQAQEQVQQISQGIEARKAVLIAEMTGDFMKEEKEITSQFDSDPLLKLKSREVDLKAMENQRKQEETTAKQQLERAKLLQAQQLNQQKMDQNEELAELRADTSIEKQEMANDARFALENMKPNK
jgi:hypothetical protein